MGDSITEIIEEARRAKKRQIADRERALAGTPAMPERTGAKAPEWWERNVEGRVEKALPSVMGAIAPPIAKAWQKFEEYAPHLATIAQLYGPDILRGTEIGWRLLGLGGGAVVPGVEAFPLGKALTTGRDILDARDPDREPVPFEPPKLEKYPGAAKAFWEGLTEEGDVWTRLESAIEAAQDELEAGWGYWAASEAATSAVAPFAAARGGVGLTRAAAPLAQTLARPVSRVAPRAAPSIERGIQAGIRGLGAGLRVPFMVEEAAGRAIAAPFRRGQPRRGLVEAGEDVPVSLTPEDVDEILGIPPPAAPGAPGVGPSPAARAPMREVAGEVAGEALETAPGIPERYSKEWPFGLPPGKDLAMGVTGVPLRGAREEAAHLLTTRQGLKSEISQRIKMIRDEGKAKRRAAITGAKRTRLAVYDDAIQFHRQEVRRLQGALDALPEPKPIPSQKELFGQDPLEELTERLRDVEPKIIKQEFERILPRALAKAGITPEDYWDLQRISPGVDTLDVNRMVREAVDIRLGKIREAGEKKITGGNTQQLPINVVSRAEAQANIAKEVFEPVEGSRIDEAATAYLRASKEGEEAISAAGAVDLTDPIGQYWRRITDNYNKYIRGMGPPSKDFPVHPDFVTQSMRNIGLWIRYMTDPTRMLQAIDQGVFGGSVQRYILWVTRRTDIASKHFAEAHTILYRKIQDQYGMVDSLAQQLTPGIGPLRDVKRTKMLRSLAGDVLEEISYNDVNVPVGKLLSRPSIARWLTKITPQEKERVVGFAQRTRIFFDDLLVKQNQARVVRGQDPIGYIENYRPWVAKRNIWSKIGFGKQTPAQLAAEKEIPDFVTPKAWFNPRAQTRREGMVDYWKERDLQILAGDYVETASKDIFYTNIIQNAKPYIKQMRSRKGRKGLGGAARGVEQWIMESYAGTKPRISQTAIGAEEAVGGAVSVVTRGKVTGGIPVRRGMFAIRKNLTRAVFPLNWSWNLATQTASTANAFMRYGIVRTLQGLGYITSTATRREVRDNAYSVFVKRRRAGRAVYQDTGVGTMAQIERTPIEKAEDLANFITNTLEDNLTGVSTQAARREAESLGLTGRALWEYASEGGAKTQSMYNIADMPGLLRAPEVGAVAPFQTFAFDMMNNVLEAMPFIPGRARVGAYAGVRLPSGQVVRTAMSGTTQNRLKALGRWVAGITAFAIASDYALGRQPWKLSSFLPFYGFVLEGYVAGNPFNKPLPTKYAYDFTKAIQAYTKYGDWEKLRTWFIGYHALGGTQINRTIKGIEAVAEGEVTDVRGETLFDTEPPEGWMSWRGGWEAWKAITQGPYAVTEGRAYVEELKGGLVEEYIGDWPRAVISSFGTWTESEEDKARRAVDRFTLTLGGVETNYSDLYKHPFVRRSVKKQLPSNLRDSVDEYIDADYAERKELIRTQAFRDIRDAVSEAGRSGGMLYYLRGKFIEAAPSGWETVAASVGRTFPGSQEIREVILEWEEKGRKVPEYDYDTWEEKE